MVKKLQDAWNQEKQKNYILGARTNCSHDHTGTTVTLEKHTKDSGHVGKSHTDQD